MLQNLKRLIQARDLLEAWTWRIIRARYQQSLLGGLWAVIQPASTVIIFSIIFTRFMHVDTNGVPYVLFSFATVVPWNLFAGSIADMVDSLVANINLVTKIYFPREILPAAAMLARLLDFGIASSIVVILMIYFQVPLFVQGWVLIPVILVIQLALALGIGLVGAALNVFYRDVRQLFLLAIQLWMYASPVIYPVSAVPEQLRFFYYINPMAGVIQAYRDVLLYETIPGIYLLWPAIAALGILLFGYWFFRYVEYQFADVV